MEKMLLEKKRLLFRVVYDLDWSLYIRHACSTTDASSGAFIDNANVSTSSTNSETQE